MSRYPFYVVLIIRATVASQARTWLERNGFGDGLRRALIRESDPDTADPIAWAMLLQCTPGERTSLQNKAEEVGANAEIFWSTNRRDAKQEALAFIQSKGLKVKPVSEA